MTVTFSCANLRHRGQLAELKFPLTNKVLKELPWIRITGMSSQSAKVACKCIKMFISAFKDTVLGTVWEINGGTHSNYLNGRGDPYTHCTRIWATFRPCHRSQFLQNPVGWLFEKQHNVQWPYRWGSSNNCLHLVPVGSCCARRQGSFGLLCYQEASEYQQIRWDYWISGCSWLDPSFDCGHR